MKKTQLLNYSFSFIYVLGKVTLGLLLHPYQTMLSLVREKFFLWLTLAPTIIFFVLTLLWRAIFRPLILLFFQANCPLMIAKTSVLFFCLFWQIALLYLLCKFIVLIKESKL
ncbi:MAG: hypothetical protein Q4G02_01650 [bacterium]|nr:hypothetical protein [bacterium]